MVIYRITNTANGKVYIGQTIRSSSKRWREHINNARTMHTPLYHAIKAHGPDIFKFEVIDVAISLEELNKKEENWILVEGSMHPDGYNLKNGGDNKTYCDLSKQKISNSHKGKIVKPEYRINYSIASKKVWESQEHRDKHRIAMAKAMATPEYKFRQSRASKKRWSENGEYLRKKMSETHKGIRKSNETRQKMVVETRRFHAKPFFVFKIIAKNTLKFIGIWENQVVVAQELGLIQSKVSQCLHEKRKSHKGYVFIYQSLIKEEN